MSLNCCTFTGRLTADPKLNYVGKDQVAKVTFTLAVDRDRRKEDGSRNTDFLDFIAWRGTAKFISDHCRKGELLTVANVRESVREYVDKDGNKRRKHEHEITPDCKIYFGSKRHNTSENSRYSQMGDEYPGEYVGYYDANDSDLTY